MDRNDLEYVGFWPRVGATIIDTLLILVITGPILGAIYGPSYWRSTALVKGPADLVISWILPAVAVVLFWMYRQATPGKMAISARIVDARTGNTPGVEQLLIRYVGYFVSIIPFFLGVVWVAFDPRKQGWHDKMAGTVVVRPKVRGPATVQFYGRQDANRE